MNNMYINSNFFLSMLVKLGGYIWNFFAFFGNLLTTKLVNGKMPTDFLTQSFYNPLWQEYVSLEFKGVNVVNDIFVNFFNSLINFSNNADNLVYVYDIIFTLLPLLVVMFFVIYIVQKILDTIL